MDINTAFTHFPTFTRPSAVANAVQANILAATAENPEAINQIYNVAVGDRTTLNELHEHAQQAGYFRVSEFQHFSFSTSPRASRG